MLRSLSYFRKGIAVDRLVGFQDLGSKDDFSTRALENILNMKGNHDRLLSYTALIHNSGWHVNFNWILGVIDEKKKDDDDEDDESESKNRRVRSSTAQDSDSDWKWNENTPFCNF